MSFDQLAQLGQDFRKLKPSQGSSGIQPLNLSEPIGAATLAETQQSVAKRATQTYNAAVARGAPPEELDRLAALAGGTADPGDALTTIFNTLTLPADLIRLGVTEALPGGIDPSSQDFKDVITLNKQRMIARNQMDPNSDWGRSGEFRGTDMLERAGVEYLKDQPGPWDEIGKGLRFVGATALDIFTDPLSLVTGGGGGVARASALKTSELITTKAIQEGAVLLKNFGDDALEVVVREVADAGTSPLVLEAAERAQRKARTLLGEKGWKGQSPSKAIDEVVGLKRVDELVTDLVADPKEYVSSAIGSLDEAKGAADELTTGVRSYGKGAGEKDTVWAELNFHIGETVAKKQFHSSTQTWKNYTDHVLYHMPERIPAAAGTVGGLSFMVPFKPSSARTFAGLTAATQGMVTKVTRGLGGKLPGTGFAERIGTSEWVSDLRAGWQKFRRTKGRQAEVSILRDPKMDATQRMTSYLGIVTTRKNAYIVGQLLRPLAVTSGTSTVGRNMVRQVNALVSNEEMSTKLFRYLGEAHIQGGKADVVLNGLEELGITATQQQKDDLTRTVTLMRKLQEMGDKAYGEVDPKFKAMLDNSNRTYTPLRVLDQVDKRVRNNRGAFDRLIHGWREFLEDPDNAKLGPDDAIAAYARLLGNDVGIPDLSASDFALFIDFINGFKDIRIDTGLQALGSSDVLRMRRLGATARVIEEVVTQADGTKVKQLRTVQDWNDLGAMNTKFTRLLNEFLPDGQKVDDVFETNPALLVEHWYSSIHSAVSERLLTNFMWKSKLLKDADEKLTLTHLVLNRMASNDVVRDGTTIIQKLFTALMGIDTETVDPKMYDNIIDHVELNSFRVMVGGVEMQVPTGALRDVGFLTAINEANLYLGRLSGKAAQTQAAALRALIGESQATHDTASGVMNHITEGLRKRHKRARDAMAKSWRENIETQYAAAAEGLEAAGGTAAQQKTLLDRKKKDLTNMRAQLRRMDTKAEKAQAAIAQEAMDTAINREMNTFVDEIRTTPAVQTSYDVGARAYRTPEDFSDLFVAVAEGRVHKVELAVAARDVAPPEARAQYGIEANEYRRVSENLDTIPVSFVARDPMTRTTDAGWVKPEIGQADIWVEYYPAFGGPGYDSRSGKYSHPGAIDRVWPEGKREGEPATEFAKSLGWTDKGGVSIKQWWDESFLEIGYGVFKYTGNSTIPFYVLSDIGSIHDDIFRGELTQVWHELNHSAAVDQPLAPLRLWGLEATGLKATAEDTASPDLLDAIAEIRARGYGAEGASVRGTYRESVRYVSALQLYDEMIVKKAERMVKSRKVNKITMRDALSEARKKYLLTDFLDAHGHALMKEPGYVRRMERLNTTPMGGYRRGQDPSSYARRLTSQELVEKDVYVSTPRAHEHNQALADQVGIEDWPTLAPMELFHRLQSHTAGTDLDLMDTPLGSREPINPYQRETIAGWPVYTIDEARDAAGRVHYEDDYKVWLQQMADSLGVTTGVRPQMEGLDINDGAVWELEEIFEELTGVPTTEVYPDPIALMEIPELSDEAAHIVNQAYAERMGPVYERNPKLAAAEGRMKPHEKMMRLRAMGWDMDSEDFLAYSESPDLAEFRIGETQAVSERLEEFGDEQTSKLIEQVLGRNQAQLAREYADISKSYRNAGKPSFDDTENEFWGWLEKSYPGTRDAMQATQQRAGLSAEMEAGRRLLATEKRLALGPKPQATPRRRVTGESSLQAWRRREREFTSSFAAGEDTSPEVIWRNFYTQVQGRTDIPPEFAQILDTYQRSILAFTEPELLEKDIITAYWSENTLAEIEDDRWIRLEVDTHSAREGKNRARHETAQAVSNDGYRLEELMLGGDADRRALQDLIADPEQDQWWQEGVFHDEANPTMEDLAPEDFQPETVLRGDDIRTSAIHISGLKRRQRHLKDTLRGQTFIDLDLAEIGRYDGRYFTSAFEPKGSVAKTGYTGETMAAADVSWQGADYAPMSMPTDEFDQPIRHPVTGELMSWQDTNAAGMEPTHMDEMLADEFGEPGRIGSDPRRMADPGDRENLDDIAYELRPGTTGRQRQSPTGYSQKLNRQGPRLVRRFQEQQNRIRTAFEQVEFGRDAYLNAARRDVYQELVTEGDSHLMSIVGNNDNWLHHGLEYVGVDIGKLMDAWNAFKETLNPVYLQDSHLKRGFAYVLSMKNMSGPAAMTEKSNYAAAVKLANLDIDTRNPKNLRYSIRRQIDSDFAPLRGPVDILGSARQRRLHTSVAPVGPNEQKILRGMQAQARRMEAGLERPAVAPRKLTPAQTAATPEVVSEGGITRVISGGQVGADRIGLEEAAALGLETGGTAPAGYRTQTGNDPSLADYGLVEHESRDWQPRTLSNVEDSDGTILFGDPKSPGSKLTIRYANQSGKPLLVNPSADQTRAWVKEHNIRTLNVAGNRSYEDATNVNAVLKAAMGAEAQPSGGAYVGSTGPSRYGTEVINVGRGRRKADVDIMRPGPWGNPYTHDERYLQPGMTLVDSVEDAVENYEAWLLGQIERGRITREQVASLSGKTLGCVDAPGPCHGDVLAYYADRFADELGRVPENIPAAVDVDRGWHKTDNWGNPFFVANRNDEKLVGQTHPFYRRRRVEAVPQAPEEVLTAPGVRQKVRPSRASGAPVWEPVPYETVSGGRAEAASKFYEMLWDMIDDPEFGPAVRAQLVDQLHGRTLFAYGTGANAESRVLEARMLADAVDWIESGMYDSTVEATGRLGRPIIDNKNFYVSTAERDTLDRMVRNVDIDAANEFYDKFEARLAPAVDTQVDIDEERLVAELDRQPGLLSTVLEGAPDYPAGKNLTRFRESVASMEAKRQPYRGLNTYEVGEMHRALASKLTKVGAAVPDEMLRSLDHGWSTNYNTPVLTVLTQAARRTTDPRAQFLQVPMQGPLNPAAQQAAQAFIETSGQMRPHVLVLQQPGSEQRSWLDAFDIGSVREIKKVSGKKPIKVSLTLREIHEMGEGPAKEQGLDILWEMAEGQDSLRTQIDRLTTEIDGIKQEIKTGMADTERAARGVSAEAERAELTEAMKTLNAVTDLAWETSYTGTNQRLRRMYNMYQPGDLPSGGLWDGYQRALLTLPEDKRHSIQFLVDAALTADLHPSFKHFEAWWFDQKNTTVQVAKAMRRALNEVYADAGANPLLWSQVVGLRSSPVEQKIRALALDWGQLLEAHPNRETAEALFTELDDAIGITDARSRDANLGTDLNKAGRRKNLNEVIDAVVSGMEELDRHPTIDILRQLGAFDLNSDTFKRMRQIVEQLKIQPTERTLFGEGISGSYLGLAGEIEDGMMNEFVAWEFYRALNRMQLAADPRIGMEIMGAASDVMRWWSKAATVARVTFHMRNLISGMWNNLIIGVGPIKAVQMMPDVARYVRNRRKLGDVELWGDDLRNVIDGYLLDGISEANKDVFSKAIKAGVLDSAFATTLPRSISGAYGRRAWAPWNPDNKYFQWGTEGMEFVEGILRMSAFKHYYDAGFPHMTSQMGKVMVDMVHFDYSDMSMVDKYAKQFAPFWIWTSRNLPLQMRQMLGNPRMLLMYEHARQNWNDQFGDWEDENNKWLETGGRWILPFRQEDELGNWVQMSWEPALPFNDLLETPLFKQTFNDGGPGGIVGDGALSPGLWMGWITGSLAPQYSSINDLVTKPRDQYRTTNAPPIFSDIFDALGAEATPQGDVRIPQFWNALINTSIPFFTEYSELAGIASSSPYNAGNQGYLPEEYMARSGLQSRVTAQRLGRGLGIHWRSPEDVYWTWKDYESYLEQQYFEERVALSANVSENE